MLHAVQWQQLANKLYNKRIPILPGLIYRWIHFCYSSDLSVTTRIGKGTTLGHGGIGVVINSDSVIGENCIIAQNVTLAKHKGGTPVIKNNVYIGHGSIVMGGVTVGNNAFVGALTLVNKDVPENAIVAGIPARILRIQTEKELEEHPCWESIKKSLLNDINDISPENHK